MGLQSQKLKHNLSFILDIFECLDYGVVTGGSDARP